MRKIFGFFIFLVALSFLGAAYSRLVQAEEPTCESVLAKKLVELVKTDKTNILELQYELTALKLARETLGENKKTIESYIRKQTAVIEKLNDKDNQKTQESLKALYKRYGQPEDLEIIEAALQASVDKVQGASYFTKETRFKNKDVSAYVLAKIYSKDPGDLDMNDVSILWFKSEISEGLTADTFRGSASANMKEVSTRVAQLTGVAGAKGSTQEAIDYQILVHQAAVKKQFDEMILSYSDDFKKSCASITVRKDCATTGAETGIAEDVKKKALNLALSSIVENLQKDEKAKQDLVSKVSADLLKNPNPIVYESIPGEPEKSVVGTSASDLNKDKGIPFMSTKSQNAPNSFASVFSKTNTPKPNELGHSTSAPSASTEKKTISQSAPNLYVNTENLSATTNTSSQKINSAKPADQADPKKFDQSVLVSPDAALYSQTIVALRDGIQSAPPIGFKPDLTPPKNYSSKYKGCNVTYSITGISNARMVNFTILDAAKKVVCSGSYPRKVLLADDAVFDLQDAQAACKNSKLSELCP